MNGATSGGTSAFLRGQRLDLAVARRPGRSSPRSSCRSPGAPSRLPSSASCATELGRLAHRARPPCGRRSTRNESPPSSSSRSASRSNCVGDVGVLAAAPAHAADDIRGRLGSLGRSCPCARSSAYPPTTSARTSSGWCARSACCATATRARDRRRLARTAPASSPTGSPRELGFVSASCTGRARRASAPRTSPASGAALADGRRARARDGLRLLPRSRRRAAPDRGRRGGRRPRARLALRARRRRSANWGRGAARSSRSAASLRARPSSAPRPRPDRRLQVLPPAALETIPTSTRSTRRATRSRSRRPTASLRAGFRGASRCRSRFTDRESRAPRR